MTDKKFGLLGEKLSHSLSPQIHSLIGDYEYKLYPMPRRELENFFENNTLDGFNVTIPYKIAAAEHCAVLSEAARLTGSVNTVIRMPDGTYYGDNTDLYGFECAAKKCGCDFKGKKVLILGSGGARRTAEQFAVSSGAAETVIISRSGENNYNNLYLHKDADIIVNTTPVGMYPDNGISPIDLSDFPKCTKVIDLIYNPLRTVLIQQAQALGIDCVNGLYMLASQAVRSASAFLGEKIPDEKADEIYNVIFSKQRNITLVGMPGCGKTEAGKALALSLGRKFTDTDEEIEKSGEAIPEIFEKYGEENFRSRETDIIKTVCRESGLVIATGGGAVLKKENRTAIKENSAVIFLDSPLEKLVTDGRPLSQNGEALKKLYSEREKYYRECADFTVTVDEDINETVRRIKECLFL